MISENLRGILVKYPKYLGCFSLNSTLLVDANMFALID